MDSVRSVQARRPGSPGLRLRRWASRPPWPDSTGSRRTARPGGPPLAGLDLRTGERFDPLLGLSPFSLVLEEQPARQLSPDVGLLIGTNTQEGNLYLVPQGHFDSSTRDDVERLAAQVDTDPAALVQRYRARFPSAGWGELRSSILGDALFRTGSDRMAHDHAQLTGAATHRYEFSWRSAAVDGVLGAAHAVETPVRIRHHRPGRRWTVLARCSGLVNLPPHWPPRSMAPGFATPPPGTRAGRRRWCAGSPGDTDMAGQPRTSNT